VDLPNPSYLDIPDVFFVINGTILVLKLEQFANGKSLTPRPISSQPQNIKLEVA
jgi:hypothetical protein